MAQFSTLFYLLALLWKLRSIWIDIPTHRFKIYCLCDRKTGLNRLKPGLDQDWSKERKRLKKTTVSIFFGLGLAFGFRKCLDWSQSQSFFFGPKNQTGLDFRALLLHPFTMNTDTSPRLCIEALPLPDTPMDLNSCSYCICIALLSVMQTAQLRAIKLSHYFSQPSWQISSRLRAA